MERFKWIPQSLHGGDQDREDDLLGEFEGSDSWSPLQRLYGFAASLVIGFAFVLLSLIVFYRPIKFGIMFTFGNILAVGSTAFLIGPVQQARMMLDPVRIYATAIYVGSAIVALVCALWIHSKMLTLIAIIIEICALVWYSLSYVPFARRMVSELFASCCDTEF
ncbi:Got1/Sft2-like family [Musa troglodytarum]|uniref:Vesicle transport protein n=2 Tax=Musa troglodytarum TaxID=320322 RepID=A0A9E7GVC2_9LILI|nr:Got1/Sft2-like family [Musa troglodytarum]